MDIRGSNDRDSCCSDSYSIKRFSTLKPPQNLSNHFKEIDNFFSQQNKDTENITNCKYCNIEESINNLNHKNAFSLFHINTCDLPENI